MRLVPIAIFCFGCVGHGENPGLRFNYDLTGTITQVDGKSGTTVGDPFRANINFSKPVERVDASSSSATYQLPNGSMSLFLGDELFSGSPLLQDVVDNAPGDSIVFRVDQLSWELDDPTGAALDSTEFFAGIDLQRLTQPVGFTIAGAGSTVHGTVEELTLCCF